MADHPLGRRIADVLDLQPDAPAIEYDGRWLSWGQIAETAHRIGSLDVAQLEVGILLRNTPAHVAAFLGVLMGGGTVVVINPSRGDERIRADIESLNLPLVIGTPDDLSTLGDADGLHDHRRDLRCHGSAPGEPRRRTRPLNPAVRE